MGAMKRRATAKMFAPAPAESQMGVDGTSQPSDGNDERICLPACRRCGCEQFTLQYQLAKLRYTILAECVGCRTRRVISLDAAHAAREEAKKRPARKRRSRSKRKRVARQPVERRPKKARSPKQKRPTEKGDRRARPLVQKRLFPP